MWKWVGFGSFFIAVPPIVDANSSLRRTTAYRSMRSQRFQSRSGIAWLQNT